MEHNFGERKGPNSSTVVSWGAGSSPVISVMGTHTQGAIEAKAVDTTQPWCLLRESKCWEFDK